MLFNSYIFVLFFLVVVIAGYFLLNRLASQKISMTFLLGMSLWFYGFFNYSYLLIMVTSIVLNFAAYKLILRFDQKKKLKKTVAVIAILMNIGALFYYKYYDFFIENINAVFQTDFNLQHILLPLGISFFTFQQLSFIVDAYKGEIPKYDFVNYACFVSYFPQLVAGPIVTHDELVPQFADSTKKRFDWDNFTKGLYAFVLGLSKKVLIADVVGNAVNWGYSNIDQLDTRSAIVVMVAYTIQIYFDFSGYSDMAVGMAKMMNIDLPQNFNSPYKALTINDFWSRWHMTLTRFFTKYIYIPLGGNRRGTLRTYLNIMIVYLVSGIWHGADWTFIFWGVCHGLCCVVSRHFQKGIQKIPAPITWAFTFLFVNVMWVFFRADSMAQAMDLLGTMLSFTKNNSVHIMAQEVFTAEWQWLGGFVSILTRYNVLVLAGYLVASIIAVLTTKTIYERMSSFKPKAITALCVACLLVLCIVSFSGVSTFLYFNF